MTPEMTEDIWEEIIDQLPHGSGIDWDWQVGRVRWLTPFMGVVNFHNKYEQDGGYGTSDPMDFTVCYEVHTRHDARCAKFRNLYTEATEQIVYDEEGEYDGLDLTLDYLFDCFRDTEVKL